ncbi:hypothetical protein FB451DRAFT_1172840 [Mycena latifolia]|nr:hypothetical protein FB451DRAFT_1172840 [Mycena latifolia]
MSTSSDLHINFSYRPFVAEWYLIGTSSDLHIKVNNRNIHEQELTDFQQEKEVQCKTSEGNGSGGQESSGTLSLLSGLADFIAALTLTDEGPILGTQPSKLFTSREEFQEACAAQVLTGFNADAMPIAEATTSINVLLGTPRHGWHEGQALEIIAAVQKKNLRGSHNTRDSAEKSDALKALQALNMKINFIGKALPPSPEPTTPMVYDTSHLLKDPIAQLDIIAQMLILLGIVCHVIIGIATDLCNFIIQTVTMIIKCTMSLHMKMNVEGTESYGLNQEDILKQLPSSLYAVLNSFNIDGQTTIYAVCPSCHHMHLPINADSAIPVYPSRCMNHMLRKDGIEACATELVEKRQGHLWPIKTFLSASFIDDKACILARLKSLFLHKYKQMACALTLGRLEGTGSIPEPSVEPLEALQTSITNKGRPGCHPRYSSQGLKILAWASKHTS